MKSFGSMPHHRYFLPRTFTLARKDFLTSPILHLNWNQSHLFREAIRCFAKAKTISSLNSNPFTTKFVVIPPMILKSHMFVQGSPQTSAEIGAGCEVSKSVKLFQVISLHHSTRCTNINPASDCTYWLKSLSNYALSAKTKILLRIVSRIWQSFPIIQKSCNLWTAFGAAAIIGWILPIKFPFQGKITARGSACRNGGPLSKFFSFNERARFQRCSSVKPPWI